MSNEQHRLELLEKGKIGTQKIAEEMKEIEQIIRKLKNECDDLNDQKQKHMEKQDEIENKLDQVTKQKDELLLQKETAASTPA